jgi:hypothetical protein
LSNDTALPGNTLTLQETLEPVRFGVNAIVQTYSKLDDSIEKKKDLGFIRELIKDIDKLILKG